MTIESDLLDDLGLLSNKPLQWVRYAFPWGEPGELEKFSGPDDWAINVLGDLEAGLIDLNQAMQIAITSGHGVGKSALFAWLLLWAISTLEDTRGVITANTENQLKQKTWAELGKWYRLFIGKSLFKLTATAIFSNDPAHERTWRIDQVPWSEHNTEAFAGLHNKGKRIIVAFDEASAIPDVIWETTEGALTDSETQIIWVVAGNPTRNTGRFRECFGRYLHRWHTFKVDSREVKITNKEQIDRWIADYGEDSDFVRVRVKGEFPRAGTMQFIPTADADAAALREEVVYLSDPLVLGVDVARFGEDSSVIYVRRGRDARSIAPIQLRNVDTMSLAGRVADEYQQRKADAVFVDGTGVGGGVVDRLRQLRVPVIEVQFGAKADRSTLESDGTKFANKRAEIWGAMREWLKGGSIPRDADLLAQLTAPEYGYNIRNEIQLESKDDMRRRGKASPDIADALAVTFAYPVMPRSDRANGRVVHQIEFDPFAEARMLV